MLLNDFGIFRDICQQDVYSFEGIAHENICKTEDDTDQTTSTSSLGEQLMIHTKNKGFSLYPKRNLYAYSMM